MKVGVKMAMINFKYDIWLIYWANEAIIFTAIVRPTSNAFLHADILFIVNHISARMVFGLISRYKAAKYILSPRKRQIS